MDYPIYKNGVWLKPEEATFGIKDLGFLRGFGIFDFFRIMSGKPVFLSDHLDRFLSSAQKMNIPILYSKEELSALIWELAQKSTDECLGVKMILTAGDSLNGFDPIGLSNLWVIPQVFTFADPERGMKLKSFEFQREMADIKSLNYAFALRNWSELKSKGFDDVIYVSKENGVSESSRSNLFFVKNGVFYTPESHILQGITRKHILHLIQSKYTVKLGDFSLEDFKNADEVFTTGSTKRVVPITQIDAKIIHNGTRGPLTKEMYHLLINHENR
ncbi:aminotransferase class IV [Aquirufa sp. ROCK2-A2]